MKKVLRQLPGLLFLGAAFLTAQADISAQTQTFTTAGQASFTVPQGVLSVKVECVGGGGAGGRVTPSNVFDSDAAGGGGGGAYASGIVPVTAGNTYALTVGAGGINNGTSVDGGDSFFDTGAHVLAKGGSTRSGNDNVSGVAGGQASASAGSVKYNGGNGGDGDEGDADGGGGGGAAGSTGNGYAGSGLMGGGIRASYGGAGGTGGDNGAHGAAGSSYGGGGGGSSANGSNDRDGGPGASGIVVISWAQISGFAPQQICNTGNATVTLSGTNLTGTDSVTINGLNIPFTIHGDTQLVLSLPSNAVSGTIVVNTPNGKTTHANTLNIVTNSVSVTQNGSQLTAVYSGGAPATYQWLDCVQNNAPVNGATAAVFTAPQNGLYAVQVSENGCVVTSDCYVVSNTSVEEQGKTEKLNVYPNPSDGLVYVSAEQPLQKLRVLDITGKQLMLRTASGNSQQLDLSALPAGIYLLEISTGSGQYTRRIILNK